MKFLLQFSVLCHRTCICSDLSVPTNGQFYVHYISLHPFNFNFLTHVNCDVTFISACFYRTKLQSQTSSLHCKYNFICMTSLSSIQRSVKTSCVRTSLYSEWRHYLRLTSLTTSTTGSNIMYWQCFSQAVIWNVSSTISTVHYCHRHKIMFHACHKI